MSYLLNPSRLQTTVASLLSNHEMSYLLNTSCLQTTVASLLSNELPLKSKLFTNNSSLPSIKWVTS